MRGAHVYNFFIYRPLSLLEVIVVIMTKQPICHIYIQADREHVENLGNVIIIHNHIYPPYSIMESCGNVVRVGEALFARSLSKLQLHLAAPRLRQAVHQSQCHEQPVCFHYHHHAITADRPAPHSR